MSYFPQPKPWKDFFDISEISIPHPAKLQERVAANLVYFGGNYLTAFACCFIFTCIINPLLLFAVIFSAIGGLLLRNYLQTATQSDKDKKHLNEHTAHTLSKWYIYSVVMFLLVMGNIPLFFVFFFFFGGLLFHAILRYPGLKAKGMHLVDVCLRFDPVTPFIKLVEGNVYHQSKDVQDMDKNK